MNSIKLYRLVTFICGCLIEKVIYLNIATHITNPNTAISSPSRLLYLWIIWFHLGRHE